MPMCISVSECVKEVGRCAKEKVCVGPQLLLELGI